MIKIIITIIPLIIITESLRDKIARLYTYNVVKLTGIQKKDDDVLDVAVEALQKGKIIGLPTDTSYAFAVGLNNTNSIRKLYNITGTPYNHSLSICVGRVKEIDLWGVTDDVPQSLIKQLLPGPTTILLKRKPSVNPKLNPHSKLVGIRVPGAKLQLFIRRVTIQYGSPLVLIPASNYNSQSLSVDHFEHLWQKAYVVYDIGKLPKIGIHASTVVDFSVKGQYRIVREGIPARAVAVRSIAERHKLIDPTADGPIRRGTEIL